MPSHDQLLKDLLRTFFPDFLALVASDIRARMDPAHIVFKDKEAFTDLPEGEQTRADLLAQIAARGQPDQLVHVHVEIEGQARQATGGRMHRYYKQFTLRYPLPVLPVVLYLKGGQPDVRVEHHLEAVWGRRVCTFEYIAFGLSGSEAERYLERPEPLAWALAALMRPGRLERWQLKLRCLQKIALAPLDGARKFLLVNIVNTYAKLKGQDEVMFDEAVRARQNEEVRMMQMTWADELEARGETQATRRNLLRLLERRFGPLPAAFVEQVGQLNTIDQLQELFDQAIDAKSLEDIRLPAR